MSAMQVTKVALIVLLFSILSVAQKVVMDNSTRDLAAHCKKAQLGFAGAPVSVAEAYSAGYCTGWIEVWAGWVNGSLIVDDDGSLKYFNLTGRPKVRDLIAEFIEVSDKHPELNSQSANETLASAAAARGWLSLEPYLVPAKPAKAQSSEKGWKTLPGGVQVKQQ